MELIDRITCKGSRCRRLCEVGLCAPKENAQLSLGPMILPTKETSPYVLALIIMRWILQLRRRWQMHLSGPLHPLHLANIDQKLLYPVLEVHAYLSSSIMLCVRQGETSNFLRLTGNRSHSVAAGACRNGTSTFAVHVTKERKGGATPPTGSISITTLSYLQSKFYVQTFGLSLGSSRFSLLQLEHLLHDLLLFHEECTDDAFPDHLVRQGTAVRTVDRLVLLGQALVAVLGGPQVGDLRVHVEQRGWACMRLDPLRQFHGLFRFAFSFGVDVCTVSFFHDERTPCRETPVWAHLGPLAFFFRYWTLSTPPVWFPSVRVFRRRVSPRSSHHFRRFSTVPFDPIRPLSPHACIRRVRFPSRLRLRSSVQPWRRISPFLSSFAHVSVHLHFSASFLRTVHPPGVLTLRILFDRVA